MEKKMLEFALRICERVIIGLKFDDDDGKFYMTDGVCFNLSRHYYKKLRKLFLEAEGVVSQVAYYLYLGLTRNTEGRYDDKGELMFSLDVDEYCELLDFTQNKGAVLC